MEINLPYPHPGQKYVRQNARRFNWLAAGRRWRKTTMLMCIVVEEAIKGKQLLWCAPTYDQVRIGWNEARKAFGVSCKPNQQRMEIVVPNRGVILYRSMDNPDNARGHTAEGIVMDECGDTKPDAWYDVLRPMLLDTGGWAWGIGTPKGRNWFSNELHDAANRTDSIGFQAPTLGVKITSEGLVRAPHALENPDIPFDEIKQMYHSLPELKFRQEILAEFVESEGAVFRSVKEAARGTAADYERGQTYYAGVDLARTTDYTVVVIMTSDGNVVRMERYHRLSWPVQTKRIETTLKEYGNPYCYVDSTGVGDALFDGLMRLGLNVQRFRFTHETKTKLVENLVVSMERQEVTWPADYDDLTTEMLNYEASISSAGNVRYNAPSGLHDDCVMAFAMADLARKKLAIIDGDY